MKTRIAVGIVVFAVLPGAAGLVFGGWYWAVCGFAAVPGTALLIVALMALLLAFEYVAFGGLPAMVTEGRRRAEADEMRRALADMVSGQVRRP
jgi:uncharacterized RDD family membrane protein YckC